MPDWFGVVCDVQDLLCFSEEVAPAGRWREGAGVPVDDPEAGPVPQEGVDAVVHSSRLSGCIGGAEDSGRFVQELLPLLGRCERSADSVDDGEAGGPFDACHALSQGAAPPVVEDAGGGSDGLVAWDLRDDA
ncbi:hypothetical protein [Streptomyces sp. NBC_00009]|uniref:hypothetical protein n=1 Tax=Streptomyces sp. NBC_00009 TaxID=2975620 RepID=UPI0032559B59